MTISDTNAVNRCH